MPRLHSRPACDRPEINAKSKLPPSPEVVWQQPLENDTKQDNLNNINKDSTLKTNVASQISPPKENKPQSHVDTTEQPPGIKQGMSQYRSLITPKILPIPKMHNSTQRLPRVEI